jgi:nicotinamide-nucleotide amidase
MLSGLLKGGSMIIHKEIQLCVTELAFLLKERELSLVTAESCTGGGLAYHLIRNEVCSSYVERGYITYSPQSKVNVLNVSQSTLDRFTDVSKETAIEMAKGALNASLAAVSVAVTGLEATDTPKHTEGVVWIAFHTREGHSCVFKNYIGGKRKRFLQETIRKILQELILFIKDLPLSSSFK